MLVTLSLGVGLKYVKDSSDSMRDESFTLQSAMILEDFLNILKTYPALNEVKDKDSLAVFLSEASLIPLEREDLKVLIEISSARAKINPNAFANKERMLAFKAFLIKNYVNEEYATTLLDVIDGVKEDNRYNTDIFNENPYLFRDYLASENHLLALNEIFKNKYHQNTLKNIDETELFYVSKDKNASIDLNYATPLVWRLTLGCDEDRANALSANGLGAYSSFEDLILSDEENQSLSKFSVSFYEPTIDVKISINKKNEKAFIRFEYNIELKKGSNFVFEV